MKVSLSQCLTEMWPSHSRLRSKDGQGINVMKKLGVILEGIVWKDDRTITTRLWGRLNIVCAQISTTCISYFEVDPTWDAIEKVQCEI